MPALSISLLVSSPSGVYTVLGIYRKQPHLLSLVLPHKRANLSSVSLQTAHFPQTSPMKVFQFLSQAARTASSVLGEISLVTHTRILVFLSLTETPLAGINASCESPGTKPYTVNPVSLGELLSFLIIKQVFWYHTPAFFRTPQLCTTSTFLFLHYTSTGRTYSPSSPRATTHLNTMHLTS